MSVALKATLLLEMLRSPQEDLAGYPWYLLSVHFRDSVADRPINQFVWAD